mgnify:CR=1 FL=1
MLKPARQKTERVFAAMDVFTPRLRTAASAYILYTRVACVGVCRRVLPCVAVC